MAMRQDIILNDNIQTCSRAAPSNTQYKWRAGIADLLHEDGWAAPQPQTPFVKAALKFAVATDAYP